MHAIRAGARLARMSDGPVRLALLRELFVGDEGLDALAGSVAEAAARGADLVVLPELPVHRWFPATPDVRDGDAAAPDGRRVTAQAEAAKRAGVAVLGGALVRDPSTGERHNVAFLFGPDGERRFEYRKLHLPDEPGFWEATHYRPGDGPLVTVEHAGVRWGVQICSDTHRPEGAHILASRGADAVLAPRATERATWPRWELVLRATARTAALWIVSVGRPAAADSPEIGGPSVVIAPDGHVALETEERLATFDVDRAAVASARARYPGYLAVRADVYADAWSSVAPRAGGRIETAPDGPGEAGPPRRPQSGASGDRSRDRGEA